MEHGGHSLCDRRGRRPALPERPARSTRRCAWPRRGRDKGGGGERPGRGSRASAPRGVRVARPGRGPAPHRTARLHPPGTQRLGRASLTPFPRPHFKRPELSPFSLCNWPPPPASVLLRRERKLGALARVSSKCDLQDLSWMRGLIRDSCYVQQSVKDPQNCRNNLMVLRSPWKVGWGGNSAEFCFSSYFMRFRTV